jgi:flavin reductase (DIM6/NTAB) family NADH-FMN oxidoreductase RutF
VTTTDLAAGHCPHDDRGQGDSHAAAAARSTDLLTRISAGTAVITTTHRGTPVGVLLTTLAPVSPAAGVFSFSLSGYSYAWPALEKATHIGVHLLDPIADPLQAGIAADFARTRVDGFLPGIAWYAGQDGVPLLDGVPLRAVARQTQKIHAGTHVLVVGHLLDSTPAFGTAA